MFSRSQSSVLLTSEACTNPLVPSHLFASTHDHSVFHDWPTHEASAARASLGARSSRQCADISNRLQTFLNQSFDFWTRFPLVNVRLCVFPDRKTTEEKSSSKKDKHSDGDAASIKASSEAEPMETEAAATAASASTPLLNGQQELLHSEGDTQSN